MKGKVEEEKSADRKIMQNVFLRVKRIFWCDKGLEESRNFLI
jgi:hypothetical protein